VAWARLKEISAMEHLGAGRAKPAIAAYFRRFQLTLLQGVHRKIAGLYEFESYRVFHDYLDSPSSAGRAETRRFRLQHVEQWI
jgi:hypothetical protein